MGQDDILYKHFIHSNLQVVFHVFYLPPGYIITKLQSLCLPEAGSTLARGDYQCHHALCRVASYVDMSMALLSLQLMSNLMLCGNTHVLPLFAPYV